MKHLDAPGRWLAEKHRRMLMNKYCGRYLRDKHLHHYVIYGESVEEKFEHNRRLRNPSTTSVQQALHGLAYCVYGKPDVRRLMFEVFDFEQVQPKAVWGCSPWFEAEMLTNSTAGGRVKTLQPQQEIFLFWSLRLMNLWDLVPELNPVTSQQVCPSKMVRIEMLRISCSILELQLWQLVVNYHFEQ